MTTSFILNCVTITLYGSNANYLGHYVLISNVLPLLLPTAAQYLFQTPNQYIFHGAEVYSDSEDDTSSSCGSDSDESECSVDGVEEDSEPEEEEEAVVSAADGEACLRDTVEHALEDEATSSMQRDHTSEQTQSTTHL